MTSDTLISSTNTLDSALDTPPIPNPVNNHTDYGTTLSVLDVPAANLTLCTQEPILLYQTPPATPQMQSTSTDKSAARLSARLSARRSGRPANQRRAYGNRTPRTTRPPLAKPSPSTVHKYPLRSISTPTHPGPRSTRPPRHP
jgi:hypothetical protein